MRSFSELARETRRQDSARERGRVTPAQWEAQNAAMIGIGLWLGLAVQWRYHKGYRYVTNCQYPADWRPVDPAVAEQYGGIGAYLAEKRRTRIERELRARAKETAERQGPRAVLDVLKTERFISAATGKAHQ